MLKYQSRSDLADRVPVAHAIRRLFDIVRPPGGRTKILRPALCPLPQALLIKFKVFQGN